MYVCFSLLVIFSSETIRVRVTKFNGSNINIRVTLHNIFQMGSPHLHKLWTPKNIRNLHSFCRWPKQILCRWGRRSDFSRKSVQAVDLFKIWVDYCACLLLTDNFCVVWPYEQDHKSEHFSSSTGALFRCFVITRVLQWSVLHSSYARVNGRSIPHFSSLLAPLDWGRKRCRQIRDFGEWIPVSR